MKVFEVRKRIKNMKLTKTLAVGLEIVGSCVGIGGIVIEYITGADLGYCVITLGAVTVTLGSVIFVKKKMK